MALLAFAAATAPLAAQSDPKILYSLTLGYIPDESAGFQTLDHIGDTEIINKVWVGSLYIGAQWNGLFVGIGDTTKATFAGVPDHPFQFMPYNEEYTVNVGFRIPGLEIKYEHKCAHPINPWNFAPASGSGNAAGYNTESDAVTFTLSNIYTK